MIHRICRLTFGLSVILLLVLFIGSVFITSDKFVNPTNTPKMYFVGVYLSLFIMMLMFKNRVNVTGICKYKGLLYGIFVVCIIQGLYGLCQFWEWFSSHNSRFGITGSFDNPAGFAAILVMGFPIGLFLLTKAGKAERLFLALGLIVIVTTVFLSGSRAGLLSIAFSWVVFFMFQKELIQKVNQIRHYRLLMILLLAVVTTGGILLYFQKKDSANGRLLIWKVSSEMIKEKPFYGHGYGFFEARYMVYQAEFFKSNPGSRFELLADNVKHPFNEFIKVAVEFGLIGALVILFFIWIVLKKAVKSKFSSLAVSGMAAFFVFATFSYPLQYIAVWLLLAFYLLPVIISKEIKIPNTIPVNAARIIVIVFCIYFLFNVFQQMRYEIQWKTIASKSLMGNTEEMLPQYEKLHTTNLKRNPLFLYNYGAELNVAKKYDRSIEILGECTKQFNDYDLQMILADNYYQKRNAEKAVQTYIHASNMIPCRFLPLFRLFEIYKESGQYELAEKWAKEIKSKKVKIPSSTVSYIQNEADLFLSYKGDLATEGESL